jgi:OOP family OmpA-OmpF porin
MLRLLVASLVVAGFGAVASMPALARPTSPADLPEPTEQQLADAVRVWDPTGSVRSWEPEGHVSTLDTKQVEGDQTVVNLNADVLFAFGSAEVSAAAAARIVDLVADIPTGALVAVEGHTDSVGDQASNLALSQRRAEAVAEVILANRDDLELEVAGYGEARPVAPNEIGGEDNPHGRSLNRRVEIRYQG